MKKKGLLISTIAMVVVLIAALTTSTYAWFTASSKTSVEGFTVNVVSDNALNIGLRANYSETYNANDGVDKFVNGTCSFTGATDGDLDTGSWSGNANLGPTVDHQIDFGDVKKAVGFTSETISDTTTTLAKTNSHVLSKDSLFTDTIFVANKDSGSDSQLAGVAKAVANGRAATGDNTDAVPGDYAYLWMGASPTKELSSAPILHIFVKSTGSDKLGIAAAIHVAYSVNGGDWQDVDAFGDKEWNTAANQASVTMPVATDDWGIVGTSQTGMADVKIDLTKTKVGELDQVQFIIYLAGDDESCIDSAKGVSVQIGIHFETHDKSATEAPTAVSIDNSGHVLLTGIKDSTVEYSTDGINWTSINGTWTGTSFTSTATLPTSLKNQTIQIRQTAPSKSASDPVTVADASNAWK